MIETFALIVAALCIKHFAADFPLQTQYMLRKGNARGWVLPLLTHCVVHAGLTFLVMAPFIGAKAIVFALLEIPIHFVIDRIKAAHLKYPFPTKGFWVSFGGDQLAHQLTYVLFGYMAVNIPI